MMNKVKVLNWRFALIFFCILVSIFMIVYKIFSIQISEGNFLQNEGNKRYIKYKNIMPIRGTIFDRNNFPLAISSVNYDLYALKGFKKSQLLKLAENFDIEIEITRDDYQKKTILKRNISNEDINRHGTINEYVDLPNLVFFKFLNISKCRKRNKNKFISPPLARVVTK